MINYEVMFIVDPILDDEKKAAAIDNVKAIIEAEGTIDKVDIWGMASPGKKAYGAITCAVQYYCEVVKVASAPREVFYPKPNVDSTVLRLDIRKESPVELTEETAFFATIKAGFGQRRKTLHNALTGLYGMDKQTVGHVLENAGIQPNRRAETLSIQEFATLANYITEEVKSWNHQPSPIRQLQSSRFSFICQRQNLHYSIHQILKCFGRQRLCPVTQCMWPANFRHWTHCSAALMSLFGVK